MPTEPTLYPNGRDAMDITLIARQARWNSERWFPALHAGNPDLTVFYTLGLVGEAGEVANLIKKEIRQVGGDRSKLADELADVFTYLILLADECQVDLIEAFEAKQRICEQRWGKRAD